MSLLFSCPICNSQLKAPDEKAGHRAKCGTCGEVIRIPRLVPAQTPSPEPNKAPPDSSPRNGKFLALTIGGGLAAVLVLTVVILALRKPAPPSNFGTDQQTEVARAGASKPEKSAQRVAQKPQPVARVSEPPEPIVYGKVSGSAWLTRNSGQSDLLRGFSIALLPTKAPSSLIAQQVSHGIAEYQKLIADYEQMAEDSKKSIEQHGDSGGYSSRSLADYKRYIEEYTGTIGTLRTWLKSSAEIIDLADACSILKTASVTGTISLDPVVHATAIKRTKTNVDGKYEIDQIPSGSYYLYAEWDTRLTWVLWLVPVTISATPASVDLYNETADLIRNQ